jgi:YidC/Oxa1 family membrane protein insertase
MGKDLTMQIFNTLINQPITNILVAIYQLLHAIGIPFALGFSIIALTALIRLLLFPFTASQMRASKKMQEVQPHVNRLKEKHKSNPQKLQQETMQLYKEFGINPVAGCLPMLVQLPIIWGLYGVLNNTVRATSIEAVNKMIYVEGLKLDKLWDTQFFGLPVGSSPAELIKTVGPLILLVPVLTGVLQFVQSRMMFKPAESKAIVGKSIKSQKTEKKPGGDFASAMQTQSMYVFPVMIGFFANSFPLGLSLYWNTFTVFGIIQQYIMDKGKKAVGK